MKKLLLIAALACTTAFAGDHSRQHNNHFRNHNNGAEWLVPAIVGGLIVYGATRPETVVVQPPPVYVQPVAPVYVPRNEYNEPPLTDRRPPEVYYAPAPRYIERTLYDQNCSCYRKFLQQVN